MPIPIDTRAERARMPRPSLSDRRFYVYVLLREDGTTPFYVGKGSGSRWAEHERRAKRGKSYKDNIICQMRDKGIPLLKIKVADALTHAEATQLEIDMIAKIGRHPHGPLTNLTRGGEGVVGLDPAMIARRAQQQVGRKASEQTRRRIAAGATNPSAETRAKMSAARKRRITKDETRQKQSLARKGKPRTSESAKAGMKRGGAKRAASPTWRANQLAGVRSEASRAKLSKSLKGKPKSPEHRIKMLAASRKSAEMRRGKTLSAETKAKMSASQRSRFATCSNPEVLE
jgi:hypothetical protein